jgi:hypothetical protein
MMVEPKKITDTIHVVAEVEPDEWDLRMLKEYESKADKITV